MCTTSRCNNSVQGRALHAKCLLRLSSCPSISRHNTDLRGLRCHPKCYQGPNLYALASFQEPPQSLELLRLLFYPPRTGYELDKNGAFRQHIPTPLYAQCRGKPASNSEKVPSSTNHSLGSYLPCLYQHGRNRYLPSIPPFLLLADPRNSNILRANRSPNPRRRIHRT